MGGEGDADASGGCEPTDNTISGGNQFGPVLQGRDFTVQLPPQITPALSGLPKASQTFTGRDEHLGRLLEALAPGGTGRQQAVLVTAVAGLAGIGKTELALQTTVRALKEPGWFPGGVLFVDLFGYDPDRRLSPEQALEGWLRALGIPGEHIPQGLQDRQRLYFSVLAAYAEQGRRILVIIDNAFTAEQARPLLPADGITAALVTSRHTLDLDDACLHDLDALDDQASVALLDQALRRARSDSDTRVTDDPDAAAVIARLCAGLPLALRIAAALLAAAPARPAASLAAALQAEHTRLDKLRRPDRAVRAMAGDGRRRAERPARDAARSPGGGRAVRPTGHRAPGHVHRFTPRFAGSAGWGVGATGACLGGGTGTPSTHGLGPSRGVTPPTEAGTGVMVPGAGVNGHFAQTVLCPSGPGRLLSCSATAPHGGRPPQAGQFVSAS